MRPEPELIDELDALRLERAALRIQLAQSKLAEARALVREASSDIARRGAEHGALVGDLRSKYGLDDRDDVDVATRRIVRAPT